MKHGRPTWRDRFSNLNQAPFPGPWNHAEVKATSQIAPRVVQKAPLLIRSGKYLICVCEGVVLRQCALIIRMSVVWRWEPFDARWTCILWGRASFCIGCFAYDTCMFMVIRLPCTYLCIFSAVLARLCIFYCVANRCVYSAECDGCTCRECHIHCSTRWSESLYWSALNLDGCWAREAGFRFGNIWVDVFDTYMSMVIGSPCPCKHLMLLLCGDPRNSSRRYRGGGDSETWDYHDSMSHTAINLNLLSCAKVRNSYRRDRSGTAAGPRRDRKTWEFPRFQVAGGTTLPVNL